jgi:hypothetical protein
LRSNSAGSGGDGSGDARYTAASTDSRSAASPPLQLSTRTEVTSPPGTWVTETVQEMPGCAEGGRIQARWMRATICAYQRAASSLFRRARPRSSASRLLRSSASWARRAFSAAAFFAASSAARFFAASSAFFLSAAALSAAACFSESSRFFSACF